MKNIAILADYDIAKRPRPYRAALALHKKFKLFLIAKECSDLKLKNVKTFSYPKAESNAQTRTEKEKLAIKQAIQNKCFCFHVKLSLLILISRIDATLQPASKSTYPLNPCG